ncbi:MAG TPA: phytanoyl-CoA dioxygenase family protein [Candidatus Acidoferrales bacterium]|nr:phytanoyl-CoA dioxygenase family protein [Candidatus Acidoferrales bacterium]
MIQLFCATRGASNDFMSSLLSRVYPTRDLGNVEGVLGRLSSQDVNMVTDDLDRKGFHVFKSRLDDEVCDRLLRFASETRCVERATDRGSNVDRLVDCFPRSSPQAIRYDFHEQDLINNGDVQKLMADRSILAVAQAYLRALPITDVVAMWWSAAAMGGPDKQAAQFWHFDMDRIKWLKFFIYLTDVGSDSGPHSFVEGSHRCGGIPDNLLSKGYSRLTDAEVEAQYRRDRFIEFAAPRGTILAEDTRGLHKGKHVFKGDRLMLQIQYSNSLFGGEYPPASFNGPVVSSLQEMMSSFPRVYSNYAR